MSSASIAEKGGAHFEQASTTTAATVSIPAQTELPTSEQASEPRIAKWRLVSLYISICLGLFLSFLDTSIVATAIFTIGVEFHSLSKVNWIALSYTLAYIGCTAIFASLSDVFGRRNAYIAAAIIFLAFSLGCGFVQSLDQLIAMRALQGVGGSGLYSVGFIILPEISSLRMLKMIGALAGAVIAMSGILGPVLGGIITNYTTWRWIFWINAPIGIGPLMLFIIAWPDSSQLRRVERHTFKQIDFLGFFLLIASSVPLVFSFQQAGIHVVSNKSIWTSALFVAPLVIGTVCYLALFGWEWLIARRWPDAIGALFPMRLAKNRVYMSAVVTTMLVGFPYFVVIYSLPTRFQVVNGHSALASGIALLPMLGASAIGSTVAGAASRKKNNTFPVMVVGAAFMLVGTAALSTLDNVIATQVRAYGLQVFVGFGFGLTVSNSSLLAAMEAELRDTAVAQGIVAQIRMLGGSIGIAASTAILGVKQRHQLLDTALLNPRQLQSLADTMPHLSPVQHFAIRQAYTDAFNETLVVCSVISGIALLVTAGGWQKHPLSMEDRRRQQFQNEATRQLQMGEIRASAAAMQTAQELK
ncbi:MFS multidrug transporter-like protein [Cucurbitaria berberidis CBS 394.84]|uniref:MFS multidrug transporter-like protein n=1 Tax=Cucurbitaria berberidis CBS 394.84 TaxID=1168544 RepID=A0A9P4GD68_9PLEO|nr:MFS multidrug transporter-like protein [Cucurbitaria berberidis CBS 394.84]KAF1843084.1 MFS multidrug transporter-like protein [Cucurbitaria berberidis CBS 394.84]